MAVAEALAEAPAQISSPAATERNEPRRVAIAHDWLVRLGGAERCLEDLRLAFPDARLLTSVAEPRVTVDLLGNAEPSFLQRIPGATRHHELLLPMIPLAWRLRQPLEDLDVVISSSYACANAVRVADGIPHVSYCHTPMRYAWSYAEESGRLPSVLRAPGGVAMWAFRRWDRRTAARVTAFVANSAAVSARIRSFYGRPALVVHPPVDTDFFTPDERERSGFVYVGRLTGYKRPDVAVRAFASLPGHTLTVVGDGPLLEQLRAIATPNVRFRQHVTAVELRDLYRASIAMVFPVNEDFGIAMAEAQACGTPVIGLAAGGALDIVEHGRTGWLVHDQDPRAVADAATIAAAGPLDSAEVVRSAERFGRLRFRRRMTEIVEQLSSGATETELL
jgi:glycosyltransferase involved in cell wall biosynthesis